MPPRCSPTSLAKAYGVEHLPGSSISNGFLRNTHGNGIERMEGLGQYAPQWSFMHGEFSADGPAVRQTEQPGVYMRNEYDHARVKQQAVHDRRALAAATKTRFEQQCHQRQRPPMGGVPDPTDGSAVRAALHPMRRDYHPGNVSTQSSASRHRLNQRYMGSGVYDWNDDVRTDVDAARNNVMLRQADVDLQDERQDMRREANAAALYSAPPYRGARAGFDDRWRHGMPKYAARRSLPSPPAWTPWAILGVAALQLIVLLLLLWRLR